MWAILSANVSNMVRTMSAKCSSVKVSLAIPQEPPKYVISVTLTRTGEAPKLQSSTKISKWLLSFCVPDRELYSCNAVDFFEYTPTKVQYDGSNAAPLAYEVWPGRGREQASVKILSTLWGKIYGPTQFCTPVPQCLCVPTNVQQGISRSLPVREQSGFFCFGQQRKLNELREFPTCQKVIFCAEGHPVPQGQLWFEYLPGCFSQAPCSTISVIPNVLKLNVLAAESSVSMGSSSSSPQRLLIDLRCSVYCCCCCCCCCQMPARIDNTWLY